ncbi:putative protein kinase C substrate [Aspergillus chevalieri]|uniref:Glucosidase 2 subunit beta n=1 Tax=Aspergillus chevalieri TaxID=182096 RepID=A0A7R7ZM95_ASPCH|nr:uncharacterized protein ACHE_40214A [Aspergillus chevalieri]BCR87650.1 hypothetical protein ACHE_40214A [Aspergillus chevalieri]
MIFSQSSLFLAASLAASTVVTASKDGSSRPRGVAPEFSKFYKDPETFTCISHPALQVPFSAVNDDYCDCPDGSDEPGTSACSYLSPHSPLSVADRPGANDLDLTSALPGFYCKNKGHRPWYIPFQRVNDGICDYDFCCDGSDEWARVGGTKCEDRCKELGKEWRKKEDKRQKSMTAALRKKRDLLVDAGRQQKEIEDDVQRLETEIEAHEVKVKNLEADLEEVQKQEQSKLVKGRKKGRVNVLAEVAKGRVEELRESLIEVRKERDETRSRVKELEAILSKFKEEHNSNSDDESVKRAVSSWEDYAAKGYSDGNQARERDFDEISKPDDEKSGVNWEHWENEEGSCEMDAVYQLAAYLPPSLVSFLEGQFIAFRGFLEKNGFLSKKTEESGPESQAVKDAREALKAEEKNLGEIRKQLRNRREDLEINYGPTSIFRALKGVCISRDAGEYTYEQCFLDQTKQNSKKGGGSMRMGNFQRIGSTTIEEVNEAGEIVTVERMTLEYARGQTCWNGPARSTKVVLECGENNEILKVSEDERCVYSMIITTPAVCAGGEEEGGAPRVKDEL